MLTGRRLVAINVAIWVVVVPLVAALWLGSEIESKFCTLGGRLDAPPGYSWENGPDCHDTLYPITYGEGTYTIWFSQPAPDWVYYEHGFTPPPEPGLIDGWDLGLMGVFVVSTCVTGASLVFWRRKRNAAAEEQDLSAVTPIAGEQQ